jgi:hypothetical protein
VTGLIPGEYTVSVDGPTGWRVQSALAKDHSIRDLPAGEYYLAAVADAGPDDLANPDFLPALVGYAIRLTLSDGELRTQHLRLAGGAADPLSGWPSPSW